MCVHCSFINIIWFTQSMHAIEPLCCVTSFIRVLLDVMRVTWGIAIAIRTNNASLPSFALLQGMILAWKYVSKSSLVLLRALSTFTRIMLSIVISSRIMCCSVKSGR